MAINTNKYATETSASHHNVNENSFKRFTVNIINILKNVNILNIVNSHRYVLLRVLFNRRAEKSEKSSDIENLLKESEMNFYFRA